MEFNTVSVYQYGTQVTRFSSLLVQRRDDAENKFFRALFLKQFLNFYFTVHVSWPAEKIVKPMIEKVRATENNDVKTAPEALQAYVTSPGLTHSI